MNNREKYHVTKIFRKDQGVQATGGVDNNDDGRVACDEKPPVARTASEEAIAFARANREKYLVTKIFRKDKAVQATDVEYNCEDENPSCGEPSSLCSIESQKSLGKKDDGLLDYDVEQHPRNQIDARFNWRALFLFIHVCLSLSIWAYCVFFLVCLAA